MFFLYVYLDSFWMIYFLTLFIVASASGTRVVPVDSNYDPELAISIGDKYEIIDPIVVESTLFKSDADINFEQPILLVANAAAEDGVDHPPRRERLTGLYRFGGFFILFMIMSVIAISVKYS